MSLLISVRVPRRAPSRVQPYRQVKSRQQVTTENVEIIPSAGGKVFINQTVCTYDIIRQRLLTPLPGNTIHHHPFAKGGWWSFDDIVDYGVSQYNLNRFKFEPLVKRVLTGRVAKGHIRHVNGYFHV